MHFNLTEIIWNNNDNIKIFSFIIGLESRFTNWLLIKNDEKQVTKKYK